MTMIEWAETPELNRAGMASPLFVRSAEEMRNGCVEIALRDGRVLIVGGEGIEVYVEGALEAGNPPADTSAPLQPMPSSGYAPTFGRCDQTGGMTMVDVIGLRNGLCVLVSDEYAVVASLATWDEGGESDSDYACIELISTDPERPEADQIPVRDIADTDTRGAGWWISADGQGQMDMTGTSLAEARRQMIDQCADDEQREAILAGSLEVLGSGQLATGGGR